MSRRKTVFLEILKIKSQEKSETQEAHLVFSPSFNPRAKIEHVEEKGHVNSLDVETSLFLNKGTQPAASRVNRFHASGQLIYCVPFWNLSCPPYSRALGECVGKIWPFRPLPIKTLRRNANLLDSKKSTAEEMYPGQLHCGLTASPRHLNSIGCACPVISISWIRLQS